MSSVTSSTDNSEKLNDSGHANSASIVPEAISLVDAYLIRARRRPVLFLTRRVIDAALGQDGNRVRRFIRRLLISKNSVIRWLGRAFRTGYRYYQRFEDQIDPQERMIKALNGPLELKVWHGSSVEPESELRYLLRYQVVKHSIWLVVDAIVTLAAISVAWLPGPNLLGWYPFFRALSHYRALKGARRIMKGIPIRFEQSEGLVDLEEELRLNRGGSEVLESLELEGLEKFLRRVG